MNKKPKTFEEAIDFVYEIIEAGTTKLPQFHLTGGMSIRNGLQLWDKNSELHKHMLQRFGFCHADDTSMLIINAANAKRNKINYDIESDIDKIKKHWENYGLDPATMQKIKK